jgi:hypothetical protein
MFGPSDVEYVYLYRIADTACSVTTPGEIIFGHHVDAEPAWRTHFLWTPHQLHLGDLPISGQRLWLSAVDCLQCDIRWVIRRLSDVSCSPVSSLPRLLFQHCYDKWLRCGNDRLCWTSVALPEPIQFLSLHGQHQYVFANLFHISILTCVVCITVAPVFFCGAIYVTLGDLVETLGRQYARCSPRIFYWLFIPCDVVSLAAQAIGGAKSSCSSGVDKSGVQISIAGLSFQVVVIIAFMALSIDFLIAFKRKGPRTVLPLATKRFVVFLSLGITLILVRCCYRIDELSGGYGSNEFRDEGKFIGLEGV